ncbi:hypothetical protein [Planomonospora sp. ID67723]|nr:hypothetical protein [Planomonospora sp. ID67723]
MSSVLVVEDDAGIRNPTAFPRERAGHRAHAVAGRIIRTRLARG